MLRTVQKLLDGVLGGGAPEGIYDDSMYLDDFDGQRRNSLSVVINRGLNNMFGLHGIPPDTGTPSQRYSVLGLLLDQTDLLLIRRKWSPFFLVDEHAKNERRWNRQRRLG
jgi:hypothetical protein